MSAKPECVGCFCMRWRSRLRRLGWGDSLAVYWHGCEASIAGVQHVAHVLCRCLTALP